MTAFRIASIFKRGITSDRFPGNKLRFGEVRSGFRDQAKRRASERAGVGIDGTAFSVCALTVHTLIDRGFVTYIIVDFEATCCNEGQVARDEMEIIEIGAVALYGDGPSTYGQFQAFVKPVRHAQLTAFCKQLTNISQQKVDSADSFSAVMGRFSTWIDSFDNPIFCSWGDYDKHQLRQDCGYPPVSG
ncbi:hypothetical protein F2P44_11880 [Massilia sp. CCM 8695]|uniref:Exonuclease domain-containing protein n=1 Tax=Massilia frigida TaxID=2609281 RepID=A0ABX0NE36_9BURK|nr:3'-5' exonuclease [Massilia frigida]NHZ79970.1 hypothetical protein [Massilia frigida]